MIIAQAISLKRSIAVVLKVKKNLAINEQEEEDLLNNLACDHLLKSSISTAIFWRRVQRLTKVMAEELIRLQTRPHLLQTLTKNLICLKTTAIYLQ